MSEQIPILNLQEQYEQIKPELEEAVLNVLRSGRYILGENGSRLENEIASLCGCRHGIGVANGTDALNLALWALDIEAGDEVITTPFTFAATIEAIALRGAKPVFVDVDPATFNIDTRLIEKAITAKTKAILPVHLFGLPAEMDVILDLARKYSLKVVEDNAQAIGAKYKNQPTGSLGNLACISFYPTKNLGACGDAGMLVTNDDGLAERLRVLRAHGMRKRYYHDELGINSRLDEVQAVVLLAKLPYLAEWNARRRAIAQIYDKALKGCPNIILPRIDNPGSEHVWHQYTVRVQDSIFQPGNAAVDNRQACDAVMAKLSERGIGSMCYYPAPLHTQSAFTAFGYRLGDFPIAETMARQVLSLPMYPELREAQVNRVAAAVKEAATVSEVFAAPKTLSQPVFTS
jgi:dTDP-4-amino-4,6-dideoxygalactose transaminase